MTKAILALYVATTSLGLILIKLGTERGLPIEFINNKVHLNINLPSVLGITLYGISFLLYIYLLSKYDLGYIIPLVTALVYIAIFVASYFVFHEVFTVTKLIGIALIMTGVAFLNIKN